MRSETLLCWVTLSFMGGCDTSLIPSGDDRVDSLAGEEQSSSIMNDGGATSTLWSWDPDEVMAGEQSASRTLEGRLVFSARPQRQSVYDETSASMTSNTLSNTVKLLLPIQEQLSGTVSVALDAASLATPIPVDGWLITQRAGAQAVTQRDQDPFSSAQLLFNIARRHSNLYGQLTPLELSLFVESQGLPPFHFSGLDRKRFDLTLPPTSDLIPVTVQVWLDPDTLTSVELARVSLWSGDRRLSEVVTADQYGRASLFIWRQELDALRERSAEAEVTVRVWPQQASYLPILEHRESVDALLIRSSRSEELSLVYPRLSQMLELPLRINAINNAGASSIEEADSGEDFWTVTLIQAWSERVEYDETSSVPITRQRAAAVWSESIALRLNRPNQLHTYEGDAVLFAQASELSEYKTQRIELNGLSPGETLQITAQPKPLVRGQLRGEINEVVRAQIKFQQLAWPWIDASALTLGEYVVSTDAQGSFAISLEPGVYAMVVKPESGLYAARVVLVNVPDAEGLLLGPQQVSIRNGAPILFKVGGEAEPVVPVEARYQIGCLISSEQDIFQGTSLRSNEPLWFTVTLNQGVLNERETQEVLIDEQSCPAW